MSREAPSPKPTVGQRGTLRLEVRKTIAATPERVWTALTSAELSKQYFSGLAVELDQKAGGRFTVRAPDGSVHISGEVIECKPPRKLTVTWNVNWPGLVEVLGPTLVSYEIEAAGGVARAYECNVAHSSQVIALVQAIEGFQAGEVRQADVHQDDIISAETGHRKSFLAIARGFHHAPQAPQDDVRGAAHPLIVVGHEQTESFEARLSNFPRGRRCLGRGRHRDMGPVLPPIHRLPSRAAGRSIGNQPAVRAARVSCQRPGSKPVATGGLG